MLIAFIASSALAASLEGLPDPGQKTTKGCFCKSECGFSVDFGVWDWCYTQNNCGSYSVSRLSYYDYCVYPENRTYESQTAAAKQEFLWNLVSKDTTGGTWPSAAGLLTSLSVKTIMEDISDIMPSERVKYIHSVGTVGTVSWKPVAGHPYTGVFASGANGLIRFSPAKAIEKDNIVPGLAIKLLRTGIHSGNFVAMPSLDGQSDFNFFKLNFTNHPAPPTGWALQIVAKKFSEASHCPLQVGLSDVATYDSNGKLATPNFPYKVLLSPTGAVKFPSTVYDDASLGRLFAQIPVGTVLFNVIAYETPAAEKANQGHIIASIASTSKFVKSSFGDAKLLFKHTYQESDFKLRPDWIKEIDVKTACGTSSVGPTPPNPPPTL